MEKISSSIVAQRPQPMQRSRSIDKFIKDPPLFLCGSGEHYHQQHFKWYRRGEGMWQRGGHYQCFARLYGVLHPIYSKKAGAFQHGYKSISGRIMGANFLPRVKRK